MGKGKGGGPSNPLVTDDQSYVKLLFSSPQISAVLGKGGATAASLRTDHEVMVKMSKDSTFPEIGKQVCMIAGTQQAVAAALDTVFQYVFPDEHASGESTMLQAVVPAIVGSAMRAKAAEFQTSTGCDVAVGLREVAPEEQVMDIYGNVQIMPSVFDYVFSNSELERIFLSSSF